MKRFFFGAIAILIPVVLALAVLELAGPSWFPVERVLLKKWGNRPLSFWPDMAMHSVSPRHNVRFVTNSLGFNDREHPVEAPPGVKRVLLLGDSYVAALNVPPQRHLARLMEAMAAKEGRKLEVICMGISGWGQAQQLATYRVKGRAFNPDMVITFFCSNDLANNLDPLYPPPVAIYTLEQGRLVYNLPDEEIPYPWSTWLANNLLRRTYAYWLLKAAANSVRGLFAVSERERKVADLAARGQGSHVYSPREKVLFKALVAGMRQRMVERDRHPLLGVIVSGNVHVVPGREYLDVLTLAEEAFAQNHIPCLNLDAEFRERFQRTGQASCHPDDAHWDHKGHQWVASILYPRVRDALFR